MASVARPQWLAMTFITFERGRHGHPALDKRRTFGNQSHSPNQIQSCLRSDEHLFAYHRHDVSFPLMAGVTQGW